MHARNIDITGDSREGSERKQESWREHSHLRGEDINNHKQHVSKHVNVKSHSG